MLRRVFAALLALTLLFALTGCETEESNGLTKVRLNEVVHSIFYAPQYVALNLGFFEEEGLEIELTVGNGADRTMTALIAGEADIGLCGIEASLYVYNEGRENHAIAFAQLTHRAGNFLVSRTEMPDFKWTDVAGSTIIGGRAGGMPQMVLEYILRQNGMDPKTDVEILTNLQFTSTAGAFTGGLGDFTVEFEPSAYALEQAGAGYVVASLGADSGSVPYTVYSATQEYLRDNADVVQRFTRAIQKGMTWVAEHNSLEIAEAIHSHFPEFTLEDLSIIVQRHIDINAWKESCVFLEDGFILIQDIMEQGGELTKRVPYSELINTEFAEKASAAQ